MADFDQPQMSRQNGRGVAVVTGASSGIGAATVRRLSQEGFHVVGVARRTDRLRALASECPFTALQADVTHDRSVAALAAAVDRLDLPLTVLVNNAGIAVGAEPIALSDPADWERMYAVNVLGVLRVTKALLPRLQASGSGHVVVIGSTVGHVAYERGGGYAASKHAVSALASTLRLELCGLPVRVTEIAPGMVRTEEFLLHRFRGDTAQVENVYRGVDHPLRAEDVADCVAWCVTRPAHVDIDLLVVRPVAQAAQHKVHRRGD